jgi:hypothetical protein
MVKTVEGTGYHRVIRRDDRATVQSEHDPALVHDDTGE